MTSRSRPTSASTSRSGTTDRRPWSTMKLAPRSQPTVMPSWKSEFIQGYGCGLFGGVEPYTVLHPVWAAIAMTDMPLARRPSTGWKVLWLQGFRRLHRGERVDDPGVGNGTVRRDSRLGVVVVLAAEAHEQVGDRLAKQVVLVRI